MLSLSAEASSTDVNLQLVNGDESISDDGGVRFGRQLMNFAGAVASRDETALKQARDELAQVAGKHVVVDAAAVAGNFQRMVRIADGTGIPVDEPIQALAGAIPDQLDLRRFATAQHTPPPSGLKTLLRGPASYLIRKLMPLMTGQKRDST
jgi:hypothetical protein